jgi:hypothetical protein
MIFSLKTRPGLDRLHDILAIWESCVQGVYDRMIPVQKGWTVIDVGSGIGEYAAHCMTRGAAKVVGYECNLFCEKPLRANAARYGFTVKMERLTSLGDAPPGDLLKVDTEGAEFGFFAGYDPARCHLYPNIVMEWHRPYGDPNDIAKKLESLGYDVWQKVNWKRSDIGYLWAVCK